MPNTSQPCELPSPSSDLERHNCIEKLSITVLLSEFTNGQLISIQSLKMTTKPVPTTFEREPLAI